MPNVNVQFSWGLLPSDFCVQSAQQLQNSILGSLVGLVAGGVGFNFGSTEPSVEQRDLPWLKTGADGSPIGWYVFFGGEWVTAQKHALPPGTVIDWYGDASLIPTLDDGTAANPFWRVCDGTNGTPDLRGRVTVGTGQGTDLTNRTLGDTGGVEDHEISISSSQLPPHAHDISIEPTQGDPAPSTPGTLGISGSGNRLVWNGTLPSAVVGHTRTAGGTTDGETAPIDLDNMQPWIAVHKIIRTARLF